MKTNSLLFGQISLLAFALTAVSCGLGPTDKVIGGVDVTDQFLEITEGEYLSPKMSRLSFAKSGALNQRLEESIEFKLKYLGEDQYEIVGGSESTRLKSPYKDSSIAKPMESFEAQCEFQSMGRIEKVKAIPLGYDRDKYDQDIALSFGEQDPKELEGFIYSMSFELEDLKLKTTFMKLEPELRKNLNEEVLAEAINTHCENREDRLHSYQLRSPLQVKSFSQERIHFGKDYYSSLNTELEDIEQRLYLRAGSRPLAKAEISESFWRNLGGEYFLSDYESSSSEGGQNFFERSYPYQTLILDAETKSFTWTRATSLQCSFSMKFKVTSVYLPFHWSDSSAMIFEFEDLEWNFEKASECDWNIEQLDKFAQSPEDYTLGISESSANGPFLNLVLNNKEADRTERFYYFRKKQFFK